MNCLVDWVIRADEAIIARLERNANPRTRRMMEFLSHTPGWRQLVLVILVLALVFGNPQTRWRIGYLLIVVLISDQTCNLIKALTKRSRPGETGARQGGFWERLGSYSFPSSHAANNFAVALLALGWWPYFGYPFCGWAVCVAISRVYLKSHYPSDVIVGAIIGLGYGWLLLGILKL